MRVWALPLGGGGGPPRTAPPPSPSPLPGWEREEGMPCGCLFPGAARFFVAGPPQNNIWVEGAGGSRAARMGDVLIVFSGRAGFGTGAYG